MKVVVGLMHWSRARRCSASLADPRRAVLPHLHATRWRCSRVTRRRGSAVVDYRELVAAAEAGDRARRTQASRLPGHARELAADARRPRSSERRSGTRPPHAYSLEEFGLERRRRSAPSSPISFERYRLGRGRPAGRRGRRGCDDGGAVRAEATRRGAALELRAAWKHLIAQLDAAREAIDDPTLHPPPAERSQPGRGLPLPASATSTARSSARLDDPLFPHFRRAIQPLDKATIDNADAVYLYAPIDGDQSYAVRARRWRCSPLARRARAGVGSARRRSTSSSRRRAVTSDDSGTSPSSAPGCARTAASSTHPRSSVDAGRHLRGPRLRRARPAGHRGNFIPTKAFGR